MIKGLFLEHSRYKETWALSCQVVLCSPVGSWTNWSGQNGEFLPRHTFRSVFQHSPTLHCVVLLNGVSKAGHYGSCSSAQWLLFMACMLNVQVGALLETAFPLHPAYYLSINTVEWVGLEETKTVQWLEEPFWHHNEHYCLKLWEFISQFLIFFWFSLIAQWPHAWQQFP